MSKPDKDETTAPAVAMQTYEDMLFARGGMDDAPCFCCGYNGRGYYQPDTHPCAKRHHALRANAVLSGCPPEDQQESGSPSGQSA